MLVVGDEIFLAVLHYAMEAIFRSDVLDAGVGTTVYSHDIWPGPLQSTDE